MAEIDQNSTGLTAFPENIPTDCEKLELYANKIKKVPPSIGTLKNLKLINCFNNAIGLSLPEDIGKLENLEEVNFAANKLAMLKDVHFSSWSKVTILNLQDNNMSAVGSLAPLLNLEELRLYNNQLTAMPTFGASHPELKIMEIANNRIVDPDEEYFAALSGLVSLKADKNALASLPSSLLKCSKLEMVQLQANTKLANLPEGKWPDTLKTLFLQDTVLTKLPAGLKDLKNLGRVNVSGLNLDKGGTDLVDAMEKLVLASPGNRFWGKDGKMKEKK